MADPTTPSSDCEAADSAPSRNAPGIRRDSSSRIGDTSALMRVCFVVFVLLASVTGVGCNGASVARPSPVSVAVSGRVLDWQTGTGVAGALVAFGDSECFANGDGSITFRRIAAATSDSSGTYSLTVPRTGAYCLTLDGRLIGQSNVSGPSYRGDFLTHVGTCVSRYGAIASGRTGRPVAGATVSLFNTKTTTDADGWYRIDLGCPSDSWVGFNTTFMYVSHPDYADSSRVVGRGVFGTERIDVDVYPPGVDDKYGFPIPKK